jgi:hypothetical protein
MIPLPITDGDVKSSSARSKPPEESEQAHCKLSSVEKQAPLQNFLALKRLFGAVFLSST